MNMWIFTSISLYASTAQCLIAGTILAFSSHYSTQFMQYSSDTTLNGWTTGQASEDLNSAGIFTYVLQFERV
jgi:hypothetical protein